MVRASMRTREQEISTYTQAILFNRNFFRTFTPVLRRGAPCSLQKCNNYSVQMYGTAVFFITDQLLPVASLAFWSEIIPRARCKYSLYHSGTMQLPISERIFKIGSVIQRLPPTYKHTNKFYLFIILVQKSFVQRKMII